MLFFFLFLTQLLTPQQNIEEAYNVILITIPLRCTFVRHRTYFRNHCFIAMVLPPLMLYLAFFADVPGRKGGTSSENEKLLQINNSDASGVVEKYPPRPPPGFARITWYMACYDFSWRQLGFTALWYGGCHCICKYIRLLQATS